MKAVLATSGTSGYAHADYARSLAEFGRPRPLSATGGWILEREIPGTDARDAMGCYPIFSCRDWASLPSDLEAIKRELVSLVVVTDPFGNYDEDLLRTIFPDLVVRFKEHFVAELREPTDAFVSKHHQYYARKALERVTVEVAASPAEMLNEWAALYDELIARHRLRGIKAFSRTAFARQLEVPGLVMQLARHEAKTVGAHLWYVQDDVVYSHLAATSAVGYEVMAPYALAWSALEYFSDKVRWLDWGAGAGLDVDAPGDGLTRFKRGWANATRPVYLCGRVFDRVRYDEITREKGHAGSHYFPAYREDEFR